MVKCNQDSAEAAFLLTLASAIDVSEFDQLHSEAGFNEPNDFDFSRIRSLIRDLRFPRVDQYEYMWAIYECGLDELGKYSAPMRLYLASLYVVCNKSRTWGVTVQGDYYFLLTESALTAAQFREPTLQLLDWLRTDVHPDSGFNERFGLFSWFLLAIAQGYQSRPDVVEAHRTLRTKCDPQHADELRVCERSTSDWRILYGQACLMAGRSDSDFEQVFLGTCP